jgi:uncharacterized protein (DUF1697 family)
MAPNLHPYVAFLRAINVGGSGVVRMADLRDMVESLGFSKVSTYIQTGNVLFQSKETDSERLVRKLEEALKSKMGQPVAVFVLTPEQIKKAAARNPLQPKELDDRRRCHLMFLSHKPDPARWNALKKMEGKEYRFALWEKIFYYSYPKAFEGPKRRYINFEKVLGVSGTARSWKVVDKILELAEGM